MQFLINEKSFIGQAQDNWDADNLMKVFLEIFKEVEPIRDKEIFTHSSFYSCHISCEQQVKTFLYGLSQSSSGEKQEDSRILFIKLMNNGPFIDHLLAESLDYHECYFNTEDVSESSLAGAAHLNGILISLQNAPDFVSDNIQLRFSIDGTVYQELDIHNLTKLSHAQNLRPKYKPSPKHMPEAKGIYQGKKGTLMDLSDEEAQSVLDKAVPHGRQYYGYSQDKEKFYAFQPDNVDSYHAYPVDEDRVPYRIIAKLKTKLTSL